MLQPQILSLSPSSNTSLADGTNTLDPLDVIGVEDPIRPFNFIPRVYLAVSEPQRWRQRMTEPEWLAWPVKDCINYCEKIACFKDYWVLRTLCICSR